MKRKVAILVYEDAEVLDFSGPFEVFSVTSDLNKTALFDVGIVASTMDTVRAVNGMLVVPNLTYADIPAPDILVVPGGAGSRQAMVDTALLEWVSGAAGTAEVVLSVCSGARILAALGLLAGKTVTTHHEVFDDLARIEPLARLDRGARFVDTGRIITTGGISAAIDGSFHVVARLLGDEIASRTARYMEYSWQPMSRLRMGEE